MDISRLKHGSKVKLIEESIRSLATYNYPAGTICNITTETVFHRNVDSIVDKNQNIWISIPEKKRNPEHEHGKLCLCHINNVDMFFKVLKY